MERDLNKFEPWEKKAFDKSYPPEEIESFINPGEDAEDPVEIFTALKQFDFPDIRPDAKGIVLAYFSETRFAPQILMQDGEDGKVMVYRRSIIPLLRAFNEVSLQIFDLFTDEVKDGVNKTLSDITNPERDWER